MKIALARRYWVWMLALLPATLGVGSLALWLLSLNWPVAFDERGLTLRRRRHLSWRSITKIGVSRNYLDGHIARIRIHYRGGVSNVPTYALQDGHNAAEAILTMFERSRRPLAAARSSNPMLTAVQLRANHSNGNATNVDAAA